MSSRNVHSPKSDEEYKIELFELLNELRDAPIIVEGRKDALALKTLGFTNVIVLNTGRGLYDVAESFCLTSTQLVVVLTDFDPEGEELAKRMNRHLADCGCKPDEKTRVKLHSLFLKNKISTVEGLARLSF